VPARRPLPSVATPRESAMPSLQLMIPAPAQNEVCAQANGAAQQQRSVVAARLLAEFME